jgi:hypothetical protein
LAAHCSLRQLYSDFDTPLALCELSSDTRELPSGTDVRMKHCPPPPLRCLVSPNWMMLSPSVGGRLYRTQPTGICACSVRGGSLCGSPVHPSRHSR